jgi:hypothetical protein
VAARFWTCRKCGETNSRLYTNCPTPDCVGKRPKARKPAHKAALEIPYEWYVEQFGERCGICGDPPKNGRRLCRDHSHRAPYKPRGLLCFLCNKNLPYWADVDWCLNATRYLDRGVSDGYSPSLPVPEQEAT